MTTNSPTDFFTTLGLPREAGEAEVRARYLELVKQFPPERAPERFREIQAAYEFARDPLSIAKRLIEPPGDEVPAWDEAIEQQKKSPPAMSLSFLLSLGNQDR